MFLCLQTCHLLTLFLNHSVQVVFLFLQRAILLLQLRNHLHTQQIIIKSCHVKKGDGQHLESEIISDVHTTELKR